MTTSLLRCACSDLLAPLPSSATSSPTSPGSSSSPSPSCVCAWVPAGSSPSCPGMSFVCFPSSSSFLTLFFRLILPTRSSYAAACLAARYAERWICSSRHGCVLLTTLAQKSGTYLSVDSAFSQSLDLHTKRREEGEQTRVRVMRMGCRAPVRWVARFAIDRVWG